MIKISTFPEKISKLSPEQMQNLLLTLMEHVNYYFTHRMEPDEFNKRFFEELIDWNLIEIKDTEYNGCQSCDGGTKKTKKEGKVIPFQPKN